MNTSNYHFLTYLISHFVFLVHKLLSTQELAFDTKLLYCHLKALEELSQQVANVTTAKSQSSLLAKSSA